MEIVSLLKIKHEIDIFLELSSLIFFSDLLWPAFNKILMLLLRNSSLLEILTAAQAVVQNFAASPFQIS